MTQRLTLKLEAWLCRYVTLHAIYNLASTLLGRGVTIYGIRAARSPMTSGMVLDLQVVVVVMLFTKFKPLAFRSAATPAEAEDWITHMEKLFQVLGCPDNFKTRLAAFKLEGDALSWWKAHLRTQVGGDAFADTCTWVAFREIFYN
ncbi:hypothetical protein Tco_0360916, partial [Tanacetum coccineum]